MVLQPVERPLIKHLGGHAAILDAHIGKDRGTQQARHLGLGELLGARDVREAVQPLDVLCQELVAHAPQRLEARRALRALDVVQGAHDALGALRERRNAARGERVVVDGHLLGGGDDDLDHGSPCAVWGGGVPHAGDAGELAMQGDAAAWRPSDGGAATGDRRCIARAIKNRGPGGTGAAVRGR